MKYTPEPELHVFKTEDEVRCRVAELGKEIADDYLPRKNTLMVVGILDGAFFFTAHLVHAIYKNAPKIPLRMDFVKLSSYGDKTVSSGTVRVERDISQSIKGADVLIVDDIVDTGRTVDFLVQNLLKPREPASIRTCTLLHKPARAIIPIQPEYTGFIVPNEFVVGCGMDYKGEYRHLPYIGIFPGGKLWA